MHMLCVHNRMYHAWVSHGSPNDVAFLQEKFDQPGGNEPASAGDTHGVAGN